MRSPLRSALCFCFRFYHSQWKLELYTLLTWESTLIVPFRTNFFLFYYKFTTLPLLQVAKHLKMELWMKNSTTWNNNMIVVERCWLIIDFFRWYKENQYPQTQRTGGGVQCLRYITAKKSFKFWNISKRGFFTHT